MTMKCLRFPILCAATLLVAQPLAAQMGEPTYVPVKIDQTESPVYPQTLVNIGIKSGAASIAVAIDDTGKMADYVVTAYSHPGFADSAIAALKKWKFEPARVHGSPRNAKADLTFRFEVEGVVVVSMTPMTYSELLRFKIFPNSMAYSACTLGQLDRIPTPKKVVKPVYPNALALSSRGGRVSVDFYIDEQGHVRIPSVSKETNEANQELAAIAVTTVAQWEFEPPLSRGKPVLVLARQDFDFKPAEPAKSQDPAQSGGTTGASDSRIGQPRATRGAEESPFGPLGLPFLPVAASGGPTVTKGYTMVSAHSYGGYTREAQADGSFAPETYALGNGSRWDICMADPTIDNMTFEQVAQNIAGPLSDQNYLPARDPSRTNLLIVVYWGTTSGSMQAPGFSMPYTVVSTRGSSGMARNPTYSSTTETLPIGGLAQSSNDMRNARMLGFDFPNKSLSFKFDAMNMLEEIESNRYFVGLVAYDFQLLWRQNVRKVLWVTRFSILEHRNEFDRSLPEITKYASQFFGQDSHGFVVKRLREGHVDVGPLSAVGNRDLP